MIEKGEYLKFGKVFPRASSTALAKWSERERRRCFLQDDEMIICNFSGSECFPATALISNWLSCKVKSDI